MLLNVKVVPSARQEKVAGKYGSGIKVRVRAPAEDGRANKALIAILANALKIKSGSIRIARGHHQPNKVIEIDSLDAPEVQRRLQV